nr:DNA polymerase IV [Armatimonadota bacterium]
GVVASCSYAARRFGVHSAMPMTRALALCPHLISLRADFPAYRDASAEVMTRLHALTPLVEQISIDEAFLDVSELSLSGDALASRLQETIWQELGLSCSLGVATNKLVAKIATDAGKAAVGTGASPRSVCIVPPDTEADFLAPLPASALWGVGPKTAERLGAMGIRTIGDLAAWPPDDLARRFGQHGRDLSRHALGLDDRPLVTERAAKSVSRETTFARNVADAALLRETLRGQVREVCRELRQDGVGGTTVRLKIRWPDFTTLTRQITRLDATDDEPTLRALALGLFERVWTSGRVVRLLGVGVGGLEIPRQLNLWDTRPAEEAAKEKRVQMALTSVHSRLGQSALRRASELPGRAKNDRL